MFMQKKKGFTLIEVIGVIVIILLLFLLATPIIVNYVKDTKESAANVQLNTIKDSAKNWASARENINLLPTKNGDCIEVTLGELKSSGYIDFDITNPETNELYSDSIKVVIRKENNNLTYEVNETDKQVCDTVIDSGTPAWIYGGSSKKLISKNDAVVLTIKSNQKIKENNLTEEKIIVRVNNKIEENAIVNIKNCTNGEILSCDIEVSNLINTGNINLLIEEKTLVNESDEKSRTTLIETDVLVDNKAPIIVYKGKTNTNYNIKYATRKDTVVIKIEATDENYGSEELTNEDIKVLIGGKEEALTKTISKKSITKGISYEIKLENIEGSGDISIVVSPNKIKDNLGNSNKQIIITPGVKVDNNAPVIEYNGNGNTGYSKYAEVEIKVKEEETGINKETLKYTWSETTEGNVDKKYSNNATVRKENVTGEYYLIAEACDNAGNCTKEVSKVYKLSKEGPVITFIENGTTNYQNMANLVIKVESQVGIDNNSLKYEVAKEKNVEPSKKFTNEQEIEISGVTGEYYVIAKACDKDGLCTTATSGAYKLDNEGPVVAFSPSENKTYKKSQSAKVTVEDNTGVVNASSLKYIISNTTTATPDKTLLNGATITIDSVTGNYYIIVEACDGAGNCVTSKSGAYYVDNSAPTITYGTNGNSAYQKSVSTTVTANANTGEMNTIKYIVSTDKNATPSTSLTNGGTVTISGKTGTYYVVVEACDKAGNCKTQASNAFYLDNSAPTITFGTNGNSTYAKSRSTTVTANANTGTLASLTYTISTSTSATPNTNLSNGGTVTISGVTGTYYVVAKACDQAGNCTTKASGAFMMDNSAPTITFGTNGNSTYAKSRSTTVTANANTGTLASLTYTTSTSTSATPSTSLTNGGTVTISGVTGTYYVIAKACDGAGNCTTKASGAFKLDNTKPSVSVSVSGTTASITLSDGIGLSGYQVTTSSSATSYTAISGTSKSVSYTASAAGTYYVHVKDTAGNINSTTFKIDSSSFCSYTAGQTWDYAYTGGIQSFTVPCTGTYKLEVWGAQGGEAFRVGGKPGETGSSPGGKGGYASGNISLTQSNILYIGVGGAGLDKSSAGTTGYGSSAYPLYVVPGGYNGGGIALIEKAHSAYAGSGGGATHIALNANRGVLANYVNNKSEIIIVAGGGGGSAASSYNTRVTSTGGAGGGTNGGKGADNPANVCSSCGGGAYAYGAAGGTQSSGYAFGQGGSVPEAYWNWYTLNYCLPGGGGGGYYGGMSNAGIQFTNGDTNLEYSEHGGGAGGGGSGYIGGVTGGTTTAGQREGNGYARITLVSY